MTLRRCVLWRLAAALLWILSIGCLVKAIGDAVTAEESLNNPYLVDMDRTNIHQESIVADRWGALGWALQFATATALALGIETRRVVRKIFVSLGILIAADGVTLLLVAVLVR